MKARFQQGVGGSGLPDQIESQTVRGGWRSVSLHHRPGRDLRLMRENVFVTALESVAIDQAVVMASAAWNPSV